MLLKDQGLIRVFPSADNLCNQFGPRSDRLDVLFSCMHDTCVDPENFVRGGPTLMFWGVFLVDKGYVVANSTISVPPSAINAI